MSLVIPPVDYSVNVAKYAWNSKQVRVDLNPPTFNTLHEIIDEEGGVRLVSLALIETSTEQNPADIDIVITLDGTAYTYDGSVTGAIGDNTPHAVSIYCHDPTQTAYTVQIIDISGAIDATMALYFGGQGEGKPIEHHDIKVEVRQTSALDTNPRIRVVCTYELLETV